MDESSDLVYLKFFFLVGDYGVGKTSLLRRYTEGMFSDGHCTLGVDFKVQNRVENNKKLKILIWDEAGQERHRPMTTIMAFYKNTHGILLTYDVTNKTSLENVDRWLNEIKQYAPHTVTILLVGTKGDSHDKIILT